MGHPFLSICAFIHACMSAWVFNMVVKCASGPIPHLPSAQISWHRAKANRHEDEAEGITMQPSMQFVLTLSGVQPSPLILMSSPGFRFTGIQHPNEVSGLGGGGGRGQHWYNHTNIHAWTQGTLHIGSQTHIFLSRERECKIDIETSNLKCCFFKLCSPFKCNPPFGWDQIVGFRYVQDQD